MVLVLLKEHMSTGPILVAIAAGLVVVAYLARPFRVSSGNAATDREIEIWVTRARAEKEGRAESPEETHEGRFCPQCGRRAGVEDRFCAKCGTPLPEDL